MRKPDWSDAKPGTSFRLHIASMIAGDGKYRFRTFYDKCVETLRDHDITFDWQVQQDKRPQYYDYTLRHAPKTKHLMFHGRQRHPNALYMSHDALPNMFRIDPHGFAAFSALAKAPFDPTGVVTEHGVRQKLLTRFSGANTSKRLQPARGQFTLPDTNDAIAVMLQVPEDSVLTLATFSQYDIVNAAIAARGNRPLLIKQHPSISRLESLYALHNPDAGIWITEASVHDIFDRSRTVLTANSGSGLEALIHGCRVITCGMADYGHGTIRANSIAEIAAAFEADRPDPAWLDTFLTWRTRLNTLDTAEDDFGDRLLTVLRHHNFI